MKIVDLKRLDELVEEGYLSKSELDNLVLYNYTQKTTFDGYWIPETLMSRGTIYDKTTGEVVSWAFPKFFNLQELAQEAVPFTLPNLPYKTFMKHDGSLGIHYRLNNKHKIATRGSFFSDQSVKGTQLLQKYNLDNLPEDINLLFEIIYPENKIVVDYGDVEELILLAGFYSDGTELSLQELERLGLRCGFKLPTVYEETIEELLKKAETLDSNLEGWVIRFENGFRVKIKGLEYLKLAKFIMHLSPLSIWEAIKDGRFEEMLSMAPEEFEEDLKEIYKKLINQISHIEKEYKKVAKQLKLEKVNLDNKEEIKNASFEIKKIKSSSLRKYLFLTMRCQDTFPFLLSLVKPASNNFVDETKFI